MQGEKREVLPTKSPISWNFQMKAFITETRMELENLVFIVFGYQLLGYLHFCVAEPAKPPLHKMHIMASMQH